MNTESNQSHLEPILLAAAEAAKLLRISERHFYKLHSSGRVPRPIRLGRAVRWRADELRDWVAAGTPPRDRWQGMRELKPRRP